LTPDNLKSAIQNLWDFFGGGGDPIAHETKEIKTVAICLGLGPFLPQVPWTIRLELGVGLVLGLWEMSKGDN